ncbi:hypothetical protein ACQE3D_04110 [Methylomonas sp. MS20]|uniref:hypothetical protein n=1 Tax=unclassified Methylomonas TaxID=2608980 RepID=UPI0028A475D9|nr:hypothetical protein [Methylomonas sp. MV1]MDT4329937.1 hypothetical protein [Methylomonas sp. MV1]
MTSSFKLALAALLLPAAALAATPAGQDRLHIFNDMPTKAGDALFSYTAEWRIDDGELYRATGLSFLNPAKFEGAAPTAVTKKLLIAIKDGMIQLDPNWRGMTVNQPEGQPELAIANRAGYALTNIIVRDYTNQKMRYALGDRAFGAAGVRVAVDLVYAADVEYLEGFTSKKNQSGSHGEIEIVIDGQRPVTLKTDGKTTAELEQELARQLAGSQLAVTPLFPHIVNKDTRNNKPFDGSELQWTNLGAKAIAINITDPQLGVLVKFKYPNDTAGGAVADSSLILPLLGAAAVGVVGFLAYRRLRPV